MKAWPLLLASLMLATHLAQRTLDPRSPGPPAPLAETLPSAESLKLLALGYDPLAADYYWLRTINEFGDRTKTRAHYPNLVALTQRVVALDPLFLTAYYFAGTALTVKELDPRASVAILEQGLAAHQGLEQRPNFWRIPFLLGFNEYYFLGNYAGAARAMALAATLEGAPDRTGPLATRLAAQAGQPELGIAMIDSLLPGIQDPSLRRSYQERRRLLLVELHLKLLTSAVATFRERAGDCPEDLSQLLREHFIPAIPEEPLGGAYSLTPDCQVTTSSSFELLRVHGKSATFEAP